MSEIYILSDYGKLDYRCLYKNACFEMEKKENHDIISFLGRMS